MTMSSINSWAEPPAAKANGIAPRHRTDVMIVATAVAALMAELRKCGLSLLTAQHGAEYFLKTARTRRERSDKGWRQTLPMYFAIKPGADYVIPIHVHRADKSLDWLMKESGPTLLVVDVLSIVKSVEKALGTEEAA